MHRGPTSLDQKQRLYSKRAIDTVRECRLSRIGHTCDRVPQEWTGSMHETTLPSRKAMRR